ncbi:MAG: response regulator [Desulfamplus sp.]|nr:response regulator [Desulfamplus sp.]
MSEKKKILVVDDSPNNIKILNEILKEEYIVMVAKNGEKALYIANLHLPDIILLDVIMPDIDGYQVCQKLKINDSTSDIPVIFITSKSDIEDEERGFQVGAVDYITKPCSPPIVKTRIKTHLMLKEQRDSLQENEERYRNIYNHTPVMLHSIDREGKLVSVSNYWLEVLGYERDEVIGRKTTEFLTERSGIYAQTTVIPEFFRTGFVKDISYQFVKKNGEIIETLLSAIAERDKDGNIIRSLAVLTDVTDSKRNQEALKEAKQSAEAANLSKSIFLANMSHEIRTPMNGIIGLTDLLLMTGITDIQRDYLENLRYSSYSLLDIINDILDISKIESNKLELENIAFNLPDVVEKTVFMMNSRANEKGIALVTAIEPDIPEIVIGDPVRIRQIVLNLVSNAVKFTEYGKVSVCVKKTCVKYDYYRNCTLNIVSLIQNESQSQKETEHNQRYQCVEQEILPIVISVEDTGIGIPEKKLDNIFDNFTQADGSITRKYGGTGLGLSISRRLVQMMGGEITVQSIPGKGSCFDVFLPLQVSQKQNLQGQTFENICSKYENGNIALPSYNGNILIAEDNPINMLVIRSYLSKMGFNITEVTNGKEAFDKYKDHHFDLIFMDIHMPELNGLEATRKIRKYEAEKEMMPIEGGAKNKAGKRRTPIIALTAAAFKDDKDKCIVEGMDFYLSKPFKPDEIINAIELVAPDKFKYCIKNAVINKSETETADAAPGSSKTVNVNDKFGRLAGNVDKLNGKNNDNKKISDNVHTLVGTTKNENLMITDNSKGFDIKSCSCDSTDKKMQIFDRNNFLNRIENNMEIYQYVLSKFLDNSPKILSKLCTAIEQEEAKEITFQAHALKGSSLTIGACHISEIAKKIEQTARNNGSIEQIQTLYTSLEPAFKAFCTEVEKYSS